ncbi:circularly permuted type 2 ATP-grasp protein [Halomonas campaniensis]|uniref:Uncharacterized protein n=2 Tax=Halomonadaceae TaxID=28256 RepID=A0A246S2U3_9GAMM|nr:circularly permuted type 2 ATP-grasp protein [Halomonas campaniensis]OWV30732.1 hypothetical protein JI62_05380 [Halomonas campaniensis]
MTAPVSTSLLAPVAHGLVEDYLHQLGKGQPGTFDAMLDGQGQLRPGWQSLLDSLEGMGSTGRLQQHEEIQRLLAENGVIFNMHDETQGRSWRLDPLPWVIDEPQWHALEAGLIQRSRLLSALYDDIYGPKTLFETGLLPSQALLASPHFLLPCHRSLPTDRAPITSHGVDVIQDTQGQWRVIADRLQAPSGTGFALENRILMARALPDMYRNAPLKRLAGFLDLHHRTLIAMAYQHRDNPTLILLTPGPGSPRYFEHAYLANYLNIALVEGQDLVVRDAQVWLRTLGGLQPVDVILRHCDDAYCDPLELRGDSQLGVPGLLQAMRAGGVALSNALGVGILEAPVLADYLPMLCEHLLGEPLLLPSADATTQPATAPVFDRHLQRLEPTRLNLRCFVTRTPGSATAKNSATAKSRPVSEYQVMPGGLAWVGEPGSPSLSSTVVKDVWVTAASPQPHVSQLRQARGPVVATRDGTDLPSRVAESLFWLGRYGERLDTRARLLREALLRLMEYDQDEIADQLLDELLLALDITTLNEEDEQRLQAPLMGFELKRAALLAQFDNVDPQALQPLFAQLMRNARSVRDHLGDDSWRVVHQLRQRMATFNPSLGASAARRACEGLSAQLAAFFGLCNETMPHHYGWRFMDIGRFLDRVLGLLSLLKLTLNAPHSPGLALWEVVLATTDNFTAYRRRYRSELHPTAILDLLLFDETNPRSVGYMLKRIERQMDRLPGSSSPYRNAERRLLIQANAALHLADIDRLSHLADTSEAQDALAQLLDALIEPLSALSEAISQSHFSHVERPRQLVSMEPDV